ncbi:MULTISPECIES: 4-hydroxy-tetrahydrodipicolinate reductase [Flavobacterium]|uniref:4-hydroxy-tetrahydrodipicolinate reductase n=2 Tax=Flavobacterium TaxID=237 RepID=A0AA94JMD5_9FLAO|nr:MULTISPECIES: 4-hydroxy-tetrahydrodipicolinate reductase [Flavobacterium]OXA78348.1 4-hydroxy-tetrahydrodipicolinate reductase [Flavobacterium columnare NBRC 100251 = ATCC 23463]AMA49450.1 4-hydroxy-tetrahydrodipicolinate reductase [Flavobacterium covae]AND63144.1 4-hydroxy-tetrahydrodipicolinate reductase [Flavobacterium covae]MCH4828721.1 4-hydroxy-tetrahydrodipicolinate reductase [Flavobacterium columnare]MCH4831975.1 4-hydroxy-tetrahydrodipicolinate reductase [Flavobacterium columnare]
MKIALLGYGKMGKVIEKIALERGHEIILKKSSQDLFDGLEKADVAIDFSVPTSAVTNITTCFEKNIPVVSGTTGWLEQYPKMVDLCNQKQGAFIYGSNFSLGVNIFFELNSYLAKMMANLEQYKVSMEEIHHTQKLDAPSGTAITLAEGIIQNSKYEHWTMNPPSNTQIHIEAKRIENIPGTHCIFYDSTVDQIEIKHTAHNREGFALGSIVAAEWLIGKKGVFTMKDVLSLK